MINWGSAARSPSHLPFTNRHATRKHHAGPHRIEALLERRLPAMAATDLAPRIAAAVSLLNQLPAQRHPSAASAYHCNWVLPICSEQPDALVSHLCEQGFDATRGASSLYAVPSPLGRAAAVQALRMMTHVVYLPFDTCASAEELSRLADLITRLEETARVTKSDLAA